MLWNECSIDCWFVNKNKCKEREPYLRIRCKKLAYLISYMIKKSKTPKYKTKLKQDVEISFLPLFLLINGDFQCRSLERDQK